MSVHKSLARVRAYLTARDSVNDVAGCAALGDHIHAIKVNSKEGQLLEQDVRALVIVAEGYRQLGVKPLRVILRALAEYRDYVAILASDDDVWTEPFDLADVEKTIEAVAAYCGEEVMA